MVWRRSIGTSSFKHADGHEDERAQISRYLQGHGWSRGVIDKVLHNKEMEKFSIARSTQKHSTKAKGRRQKARARMGLIWQPLPKPKQLRNKKESPFLPPTGGEGEKKVTPHFLVPLYLDLLEIGKWHLFYPSDENAAVCGH